MKILRALPLMLLLAVPLSLRADDVDLINPDRPGIADGSMNVAPHVFQLEIGAERDDSSQGGQSRFLSTPTLLRYGLSKPFELRVETSGYARLSSDGTHASGLNPVSIGAKFHFLDADDASHRPSLGLIGRLFLPSGTGDFRSHRASEDLRLAGDLNLGPKWAINPNVGIAVAHENGTQTSALAALTIQYNFSQTLNAFVDGGLQSPIGGNASGGSTLLLDTGAAWILGHDVQLDVSVGWGAHGEAPNVFFAAGFSRRF